MKPPAFPVFYDRSGKRLRRVVAVTFVALLTVGTAVGFTAPSILAPTWRTAANTDSGFPRRFLSSSDGQPHVIGVEDGVLSRVVRVEQTHGGTGWLPGPPPDMNPADTADTPPMPATRLLDPVTGAYIRDATEPEQDRIGYSQFATDHFGHVPDRTLILTFDDGPDPTWTPQILDILAREHVPATFFVVGQNVVSNPGIVDRIVREGHMIGNHTFTHINFDQNGDLRNRTEVITTDRVLRAVAGYSTRLFRMPYGDPDHNPLALVQGQQLGTVQVEFDLDTNDWRFHPGQDVPVPPLDGHGHVMLLHDSGGNRSDTVRMLPKLIAQARAQGYTFTTVAPLLDQAYIPQRVTPTLADKATLYGLTTLVAAPTKLLTWLFWFGTGSLVLVSLIYLLLAVFNEWRQRRRRWPDLPDKQLPFVSVVLAAYNEEKVIARTVATLRESDYPQSRFEIVAVNDGSTDATLAVLQGCAAGYPQLHVVDQPNSGKSTALNNGISHAGDQSTVIVSMDADTLFRPDTIRMLARHFAGNRHGGKQVGAVAGHVKVGNRRNMLTAWQSLEYISGICVTRMAEGVMGAIGIVPGACSAWRRDALQRIGGFCEDTLAEDADATLELQKLGYVVVNENRAVADTEAPETIRALAKQRKRWTYGNVQVLWKHRGMLLRPKYGALGMLAMPYAALSLLVPLLFMPLTVIAAVVSLTAGNWHSLAMFAAMVAGVHMVIAIVGIAIARERPWHLLIVPVYRLIYEPLRAYLLYASAYRAVKGTVVKWDKLERRNSVAVAPSERNPGDA